MKKKKSSEVLVHLPKGNPLYPAHTRFIENGNTFEIVKAAPMTPKEDLRINAADLGGETLNKEYLKHKKKKEKQNSEYQKIFEDFNFRPLDELQDEYKFLKSKEEQSNFFKTNLSPYRNAYNFYLKYGAEDEEIISKAKSIFDFLTFEFNSFKIHKESNIPSKTKVPSKPKPFVLTQDHQALIYYYNGEPLPESAPRKLKQKYNAIAHDKTIRYGKEKKAPNGAQTKSINKLKRLDEVIQYIKDPQKKELAINESNILRNKIDFDED